MTGQPKDDKNDNSSAGAEGSYSAAQLRAARRKARRLGLNPANGVQAIEMLADRGIDLDDAEPNLTDSAQTPQGPTADAKAGGAGGKQAAPTGNALMVDKSEKMVPASNLMQAQTPAIITKEQRELEIAKLERKIKQRRESNLRRLVRRFSIFVILPTILFGVYYFKIATPLFGADTEMKVEQASTASTGMPSLLAGTPFASQNEAIAVQSYLQSRDAFVQLEKDYPFVEIFMSDKVDRFLRIPEDANEEQRYKLFKKQVKVSYDNTDQLLRMEVRTPDAQSATEVSELLLSYAEQRVDDQTQRVRDTGVKDAQYLLDEKAQALTDAQNEIFSIQELQGTLSPTADKEALVVQIAELRAQLTQAKITLQSLQANQNPNQIRVRAVQNQINLLQNTIDNLTAEGTEVDDSGSSITRLDQEMQLAQTKLLLAQKEYEAASLNLQNAEAEARSQRRFITTSLPPTATFEPVYPKKWTSTFSAFMILFAAYLIISITLEVIKEQVSA